MTFKRRLTLYIFGVLIGTAMVAVFFNGRTSVLTDWMPNNRVLSNLSNFPGTVSSKAQCQLDCLEISDEELALLKSEGDVDFSKSRTKSTPRMYVVSHDLNAGLATMKFEVADSATVLIDVAMENIGDICSCE